MAVSLWKGPVPEVMNDGGTYIQMCVWRSSLYPTLLRLYFLFFAEETQRPLFFLQIILGVIAIFFFIYVICRTFPLRRTRLIEFLMSLFLGAS
jgi:hypothetical protein